VSRNQATLLGVSQLIVWLLRLLNLLTGVLLVGMLIGSFLFEPLFVQVFANKQPPRIDPGLLLPTLRVTVALTAPLIAAVHIMLSRLLAMIETVRNGDPFVPENAVRMKTIAWCLLVSQLYSLVFGAMVAIMNAAGSSIDWTFSINGWLAVLLMFVLARVFEEGTRIRADLEAMI
jgi:nitrate/nitrite transporter NarK